MEIGQQTGARVRARRIEKGVRQKVLADACGISPSYLNLIEHDKRRIGGALLIKLAASLDVEPGKLSGRVEGELSDALMSAASEFPEAKAEIAGLQDFAGRYSGWARLVSEQRAAIGRLEAIINRLEDRLTHDPYLSASMHNVLSTVTAIRSTSAILAQNSDLEPEWQTRFHRNVYEDSQRLAAATEALVGYLEAEDQASSAGSLPQEELDVWLERHGWRFPGIDEGGAPEDEVGLEAFNHASTKQLAERHLERYRADAAMLETEALLGGLGRGVPLLSLPAVLGVSLPVLFRRLASLTPDQTPDGAGYGLVGCDGSGTLTFRKSLSGFELPRHSGACPYWPLFEAMQRPLVPVEVNLRVSGREAAVFKTVSVAEVSHPNGYDGPAVTEAWMLFQLARDEGMVARSVGVSCRICSERDCRARREPSLFG